MLNPTDQDKRHGATRIEPSVDGTFLSKYPAGGKPVASSSHAALRATHSGSGSSSGAEPMGDWVVYSANPEYAPLTMYPLYPRPDTETSANSLHRKAHTGLTYRCPIGVQGGGRPFKYEIITAPAGATIGGELTRTLDGGTGFLLHTRDDNYGVVEWDASGQTQLSSHDFHIRVTDQQGSIVNLQWTVQVDNDAFVFLDSSTGNDANAGTQAAPLQTFADGLWKNSDADSTYAGMIAVFEGSFDINAGTTPSAPIISGSSKPIAYVGTGAGATFNLAQGNFRTTSNISDVAFRDITFTGSRNDLDNNRLFSITGTASRLLFDGLAFTDHQAGNNPNDNPGCLVFLDSGTAHTNLYCRECSISSLTDITMFTTFRAQHVLVEYPEAINADIPSSNGDMFVQIKDDTDDVTVTGMFFTGSANRGAITFNNQQTSGGGNRQEFCFNRVDYTGSLTNDAGVIFNNHSSSDATNVNCYKNSVVSNRHSFRFYDNPEPVNFYGNLRAGTLFGDAYVELTPTNIGLSSTDFDSNVLLTGSAKTLTNYLRGAEVASEAA